MTAAASVIVRARDEARTIERALASLRAQTVPVEVIVVDSGSTDATLEIAHEHADRVIEIPAAQFTYGYALNLGAAAASAPVHAALSAHCALPRPDWIATALAHYAREDVAATYGDRFLPTGSELGEVFFQDMHFFSAYPHWGFSNHASTWRASVWKRFPFDERLRYAEDKEWALRVLGAGNVVACDPRLWVDSSHQYRQGLREWYRRSRLVGRAYGTFWPVPVDDLRSVTREWWQHSGHPSNVWRDRASVSRIVCLAGRWSGYRAARRARLQLSAPGSVDHDRR